MPVDNTPPLYDPTGPTIRPTTMEPQLKKPEVTAAEISAQIKPTETGMATRKYVDDADFELDARIEVLESIPGGVADVSGLEADIDNLTADLATEVARAIAAESDLDGRLDALEAAPPGGGGGASTLDDLTDVAIATPATGQVLRHNGTNFVNAQLAYADLSGTPALATVATTGSYNDLANRPALAVVATSGSYNDLTNRPTLFTQAAADARYLQLTGGTLTGTLTLAGAPTGNLDATSKSYVDTAVGGRLTQAAADARYLQLSGGTLTGTLTLAGAPSGNLDAATKQYVDTAVAGAGGGGMTDAEKIFYGMILGG